VGEAVPKHVAIIMDGNGRWARSKGLPRVAGHRAGVENLRNIVRHCAQIGVNVLTVFAFSSENWRRPSAEVTFLLDLFVSALEREAGELHSAGVRISVIGDRTVFPEGLQDAIADAEALTANNNGLWLNIAANYGGRWDIVSAARAVAQRVLKGELTPEEISEPALHGHLSLGSLPDPDLFIRSGGEVRISNYLLWQLAYSELYFSDVLWPDFDVSQLEKALEVYHGRQRRFGMTGEQVSSSEDTAASSVAG